MSFVQKNVLRFFLMSLAFRASGLAQITLDHFVGAAQPASTGQVAPSAGTLEELKAQVAEQQRQIERLSAALEEQKRLIEKIANATQGESNQSNPKLESMPFLSGSPRLGEVASAIGMIPNPALAGTAAPELAPQGTPGAASPEVSPLSFRIGSSSVTPVGFMDFTGVFRTTNPGTGIGTNFGSIPFHNTAAGKLTEARLSAQNSRLGLRVDTKVGRANVLGYMESDFVGLAPGNVAVSSNSVSLRLRLYWADVRNGKWEFLGGQSWSMLAPNRKGLSALPGDLFYSQDIDVNYQLGLVWSRNAQFRLIYHPTSRLAMGLSVENPEQYIGGSAGGGLVTLPTALTTPYATQLNNGNTTLSVPTLHPDIIGKVAYDGKTPGGRQVHIEFAGVLRTFKLFNPLNGNHYTATGGGGSANLNFELFRNFRLLTNNYWSDGGGRWIFGQAPDLIIREDGSASLIHSGSTVSGLEITLGRRELSAYYGGVYIGRNTASDPVTGGRVGYGFSGSSSGHNRAIQQWTFNWNETFWRDPKYGALNLMGQYSYLWRNPWSVAAGQPKRASTNMVFLNLRYSLPGSAPAIQ